jgi:hypothetical protein
MAEVATDGYWIDKSDGALSRAVGKDPYYIHRMEKNDPELINLILQFGRGQFIVGHIRYIETINQFLFHFGELYNLLEEEKYSLYTRWKKREDFRYLIGQSFSSKEQILSFRRFQNLKIYLKEMIDAAIKIKALAKYNLTDEYIKLKKELN